jgi:hypothetical protein
MIIEISDELGGIERRNQIIIQQVVYAMEKFESKYKAAEFLGISKKTLFLIIKKHTELEKYIVNRSCKEGGLCYMGKPFKSEGWRINRVEDL